MTEEKKSLMKEKNFFTIVLISGLGLMGSFSLSTNAILEIISDKFPDASMVLIRSLSTLPSLIELFGSLLLAAFITKKTKLKPLMMIAAILVLSGGLPFFFPNSFTLLFLSRFTAAAGSSMCLLRTACTNKTVNDNPKELVKWMGLVQAVETASPIVLTPISGFLGDLTYQYSYVIYFLAIIPLFLYAFCFKEPKVDEEAIASELAEKAAAKEDRQKSKLNPRVFFHVAQIGFVTLVSFSLFTAMATFIEARNLGGAGVAGTVISMYKLGNFLASISFGLLLKTLKNSKYSDVFPLALFAVGFGLILISYNLPVIFIGATLCGAAFIYNYLLHIKWAGDCCEPRAKAFALTVATAAPQIGIFFSTYYIAITDKIAQSFTFFTSDAERSFMVSTIIFVILAIVFAIVDPRPKESR